MGISALEPGILAEANQNILYIDEVNLLPDHIADGILDAAASGWNIVERESISVAHPSRFILIGSMNPEEGELRPQLLDRFSLHISIEGVFDQEQRVEIIQNNLDFGENPLKFRKKFEKEQELIRIKISQAKKILNKVRTPDPLIEAVARSCINLGVDGHRPDIATVRASRTLAAFEGRREVILDDILKVSGMAIGFRTRQSGFEEPATPEQVTEVLTTILREMGLLRGRELEKPQ